MNDLIQVLMERDIISYNEACLKIYEAQQALFMYLEGGNYFDAHCICDEYFGLEPDYIMDVVDFKLDN